MTTAAGTPTRVPAVFGLAFEIPPGPVLTPVRVRQTPPDALPAGGSPVLAVRRHELDPMGHVNNAVYLDWAEEAVAAAGGPIDDLPRRWRLEFLGAARPTSTILARPWPTETGWSCVVDDPSTGERFVGTTLAVGRPALDADHPDPRAPIVGS
jgi:Acyl-ACP thioesterase